MTPPQLTVICFGLLLGFPPTMDAQDCTRDTPRPRMESSRDTNSAASYYYHGLSRISRRPDQAAEAFCWAERLDPSWALPLYARWTALLLAQRPTRLLAYLTGDERVIQFPEIRRIDSLKYRALLRDPLLYQRLDELLFENVISQLTNGELSLYDFTRSSARGRAWTAYGRGDFPVALREYALAIRENPDDFSLHEARARVFYLTLRYDSARVEFETMLQGFRERRKDQIVYVYESEALTMFAIGKTYEAEGNVDSAMAAYGQALVEDLSFYSAHAAYGRLALAQGDTAHALDEYRLAVELAGEDPSLRYTYGVLLMGAGFGPEAAVQFTHAIETAPDCAAPYLALAFLQEKSGGFEEEAANNYEEFLKRAPQTLEAQIHAAQARLASLRAAATGSPPQ